jgi:hypothetical protein
VPFEPAPGRDVFCTPCWRARDRREAPRTHTSGHARDPADTDAEREVGMPAIIE